MNIDSYTKKHPKKKLKYAFRKSDQKSSKTSHRYV